MATRSALKSMMREAGHRPTALSPTTSVIALNSRSSQLLSHPTAHNSAWLAAEHPVRWANLKAISDRMRSVGSVGKITKAMKMVAAAKLRSVQTVQEKSRPFAVGLQDFFSNMDDADAPASPDSAADSSPSHFVIAVTSDRGLCGGVNSSIVKTVKAMIRDNKAVDHAIMLLGDKGREGLARVHGDNMAVSFKDVFKVAVSFPQVCLIAEDILSREYDQIVLVYNQFKSVISQEVTEKPIVGLKALMASAEAFDEYEFDSDMDSAQVLVDLFEFQLATQLFNALLENATSEQAARMTAMDNASRNASDMLQSLTLSYNRQRQAAITQELSEITSGAAALD
ncbi:ATP synthase subunit gamma, mitochondrial [Gracilariopsis chorda]|uniref:F-ATPase gamma subunit n=1 Tax=Gracilariopsis chorda TaxID=448386 RepID=A0A2V3IX36_9FLOR|nr:ATP synthase subunit gamma, mitochondrial [Gracilariopsis chorda]|eukprot:PXF46716.1 ATP synthase subunit gamma, mitochondrial [Gracilariopsis chorda]